MDDDPDKSASIANDVLRDTPEDQAAIFILGTLYSRGDKFGAALALFERLTRINPKRHEAWSNMGMCLLECGKHQEAIDSFKRAIQLEDKASYRANLASAYLQTGNYPEASRWAKKSHRRRGKSNPMKRKPPNANSKFAPINPRSCPIA